MARLDYAHARSDMASIPRGVGAPPPPGMNSNKRGRLVCIKVRMLDDTVAVFHLGNKAIGQTLFDEVCRHLNLLECDYFGLSFLDVCGSHCWLDKEKPILRQIAVGNSDAKFYFVVKFYTPNPIDLEEEYTRYLFTLQIRRDLALGEMHCSENTAALLAAYLVQSECGDFSSEDYPDATYLSHSRYVPNQTLEFQKKVMDNHKNFVGMSPGESDLAMLEVSRRCDFYGVKLHPAKDVDGNEAALSVMHLGIKVFRHLQLDTTFSWARIRKLSFKRKKLLVKLHPDTYQYLKETVEFVFDTRDECKNYWKKCVEHHAFFRCTNSEEPRKETRFFISKGSSFRYHGRTQKQLIDYVREHHKRRDPFTRPLRSAVMTGNSEYGSAYGIIDKSKRNGNAHSIISTQHQNQTTSSQPTHVSMPHIAHISPADPSCSGTLDARVGATNYYQCKPKKLKQLRNERCSSDVDSPSTCERHPRNNRIDTLPTEPISSVPNQDLSISLPNVLSDDLQVACKELELETNEPPKSISGDNFRELRVVKDYDNVSEDSYKLSDHERSTRSDVGVGIKSTTVTSFTPSYAFKKSNNVVVKRIVTQSKSTPNSTDDEDNLKSTSDYCPFKPQKEYPFTRAANIVPIEIDGPNVDITTRLTNNHQPHVYTTSGAVLMKPKVIATEENPYSRLTKSTSPDEGTYGATGPLPGKVICQDNIMVTPEGVKEKEIDLTKKKKPIPPPKPRIRPLSACEPSDLERAEPRTVINMTEEVPFSRAPLEIDQRKSSLSRPALISVQSEDSPDVQKCHLFNSEIPYTLTMRNVESTQSLHFTTFKEVTKSEYMSNSLKRVSKSPEFKRRKSLDLIPKKRLPSPGNFSAQDHTISPTTPDSDVLEYLLRKRSISQDRSAIIRKPKRNDPRRQTQPVRFDLPPSPCSPTAGGSTPFISLINDEVFDECVSESRSLHEDMDKLDKSTPHTQSLSSFNERRDSEDSDIMPPPPEEVIQKLADAPVAKAPPPPPPKSAAASEKVAEMKALILAASREDERSKNESPPYIDESPKSSQGSPPKLEANNTSVIWTDF